MGLLLRVLLLVAMALSGWQVLQRSQALDLASPRNGVVGLQQAAERDPNYSRAQFLLGIVRRDLPGSEDLDAAARHFAQAVGLNPYSWRYRLEQSRALELAGSLEEAQEALTEAVRLNPRSGAYRWRLANFQLRHGSQESAVQEIGAAIALDPSLQPPALAILLKLGLGFGPIEEIWPTDRSSRLRLLRGLCMAASPRLIDAAGSKSTIEAAESAPNIEAADSVPNFEAAGPVPAGEEAGVSRTLWNHLLASDPPLSMNEGRFYLQYLLDNGQSAAAREAWLELANGNELHDSEFESGGNAVWNGDFEHPLQGRPQGWTLGRSDHFRAKLVRNEGVDGSTALRIEFLGKENLSFAAVSQNLVVEPGMKYQLTAQVRAEEISTDEGLFLELLEKSSGRVLFSTDPVRGTQDWKEELGVIQISDTEEGLVFRLRRRPSRMLDNKIRGKIWLDKVSLEPVGP